MKKQIKVKIILLIIIIAIMMITPNYSKATLQSSGGSISSKPLGTWLNNIRYMEAADGTLGLKDTINNTDLTSTAETSNNLDVHMEKNTEYGAMAILSASIYGKQSKIEDGETTTGNESGIVMNINQEWVSAGTITSLGQYANANEKYKNTYGNGYTQSGSTRTLTYFARSGDAISETAGWHGSTSSSWIWINATYYPQYMYEVSNHGWDPHQVGGLLRSYSGSIFSYNGYYYYGSHSTGPYPQPAHYTQSHPTRAVVVVGKDF